MHYYQINLNFIL